MEALLVVVFSTGFLLCTAQRGCPLIGCDQRGLNCQADFQVEDQSAAAVIWTMDAGSLSENRTTGCVGDDVLVICPISKQGNRGYVALNATTGALLWSNTLLVEPALPIMSNAGYMIATDGIFLEMLRSNGSSVGLPIPFIGRWPITSILYVQEPVLFFMVVIPTGLLLLYDTSGGCVASHFLIEAGPNNTTSVWMPVNQPVISSGDSGDTAYFIARNNESFAYRSYAVKFNNFPPYIQEKWYIDLSFVVAVSTAASDLPLLVNNDILVMGFPSETWFIKDTGSSGHVIGGTPIGSSHLSSFDFPNSRLEKDDPAIVWLSSNSSGVVVGCDLSTGDVIYKLDISAMLGMGPVKVTSKIMCFGYSELGMQLVFGISGVNNDSDLSGGYVVAIKAPQSDVMPKVIWKVNIGNADFSVQGQIIGVNSENLIALISDQTHSTIMGIRVQ